MTRMLEETNMDKITDNVGLSSLDNMESAMAKTQKAALNDKKGAGAAALGIDFGSQKSMDKEDV